MFGEGLVTVRTTKVAVGVVAAGFLVTGCGTGAATLAVSDGKGGGAELFAAMADAQQDAGSYRFEMTMELEGIEVTGNGEASIGSGPSDQAMAMNMSMPGGASGYEMRVLGTKIYMSTGMFGLPGEDQWLVIDPEGDDLFSEMFGDFTDLLDSTDPQSQFNEYSDSIEVEEVGSDTIDGVDVTEYAVTADIEAALEMMGMSEQLPEDLPFDEATYSLFIDDDALTRLVRTDLGDQGTTEMRFFDYGAEITVEEPPSDRVTDFISFFEEMTGQQLTEEELAELAEMLGGN